MANNQVQKVEGNLQIKASAEQFYDVLCSRTHQIAKMCPEVHSVQILKGEWGSEGSIISWSFIHGQTRFPKCALRYTVQIHKGEWGSEGSIISWNFNHDGKVQVCKQKLEGVDQENKKVTYKNIEGYLLKHYKSFKGILQVTPQEKGSIVTWTMEYEKQNEHVTDPHSILDLTLKMSKDIDAYLTK